RGGKGAGGGEERAASRRRGAQREHRRGPLGRLRRARAFRVGGDVLHPGGKRQGREGLRQGTRHAGAEMRILRGPFKAYRQASVHRSLLLLAVACATAGSVSAREVLGGHEGWLDRMGAGVRELGRGNTGTALADAAPAAYWNPALLPFFRKTMVAGGAEIRSLDRNGGFLSLQGPVATNLGLGVGLVNRGDYNVTAYDANEVPIGTARPQAWATYFGAGVRTSRRNAFGATLQVYASTLDVGEGIGDVDFVGGVNLGWYRRLSDSLSVAVVVRNLGINSRLSAEFDQTVTGEDIGFGMASTGQDFFPKTLVVAAEWR